MPLFPWRPRKPDPEPVVPPAPSPVTPDDPNRTPWLRVWLELKKLDMQKLKVAAIAVPTIVFFAISGLVAWSWLAMRAAWKFIKSIFE